MNISAASMMIMPSPFLSPTSRRPHAIQAAEEIHAQHREDAGNRPGPTGPNLPGEHRRARGLIRRGSDGMHRGDRVDGDRKKMR